jgi:3,4-dihydroxy 2-butanone 4-phosphate synthase/GTP cyclohydrolase II
MRIYTDETHGTNISCWSRAISRGPEPVLVRMHALDPMLDVVGTGPRGARGSSAMQAVAAEGRGVLVLLRDPP